jgi:hypothetical protein
MTEKMLTTLAPVRYFRCFRCQTRGWIFTRPKINKPFIKGLALTSLLVVLFYNIYIESLL